ncbi:hypothetical protein LCGC14_2791500, partial [marine sediment metagenome]
ARSIWEGTEGASGVIRAPLALAGGLAIIRPSATLRLGTRAFTVTEQGVRAVTGLDELALRRAAPEAFEFGRAPFQDRLPRVTVLAPDPPPGVIAGGTEGVVGPGESLFTRANLGSSSRLLDDLMHRAPPGQSLSTNSLRLYQGALATERDFAEASVREGKELLETAGIGEARGKGLLVEGNDEMISLYEALHNPSRVENGDIIVPDHLRAIYDRARELTDWTEASRLDFDPSMATVDDYFDRGWRVIEIEPVPGARARTGVQQMGAQPSFKMPRSDADFRELLEGGPYTRRDGSTFRLEPLSWNPFEQWSLSHMKGIVFREQEVMLARLKAAGEALPATGGPIPEGWRVPRIGPAFEGKPYAMVDDATGQAAPMMTNRTMVREPFADRLELVFGAFRALDLKLGGRDLGVAL